MSNDDTSVHVAVRIRPQSVKEKNQLNDICTHVPDGLSQIFIGKEKSFTYDYVFNIPATQDQVFQQVAQPLIDGCLQGYNATLLAYGQTGSGKTYTMGTSLEYSTNPTDIGIIPRAVAYLFSSIDRLRQDAVNKGIPPPEFKVMAQFMELYNEDLHDLLDMHNTKGKARIKIHEDAKGDIYLTGVSSRVVCNLDETMKCLADGAVYRSTACTDMNMLSSRSHAIFTLFIKQHRIVVEDEHLGDEKEIDTMEAVSEFETLSAKFHFVDLAGSERLKRTGATGERAKEGIAINCGLLALGNVISALGDKLKRGCHVPYRDSKLTRLLQDSLGGNSRTIMIACISPSDCDFLETLNTLQYANRAKNIRNKVTVNQDKASQQMAALRAQIADLQKELMEYKTGQRVLGEDGANVLNDLHVENNMLQKDNVNLSAKLKAAVSVLEGLQSRNAQLLADLETCEYWRRRRQSCTENKEGVMKVSGDSLHAEGARGSGSDLDQTITTNQDNAEEKLIQDDFAAIDFRRVIQKYTAEMEELRSRLLQSEALNEVLERAQHANRALLMTAPHSAPFSADYQFDFGGESVRPNASNLTVPLLSVSGVSRKKNFVTSNNDGFRRLQSALSNSTTPSPTSSEDINRDSRLRFMSLTESLSEDMDSGAKSASLSDIPGSADELPSDSDTVGEETDSLEEAYSVDDASPMVDNDEETNILETLASLDTQIDKRECLLKELRVKARELEKMRRFYEKELKNLRDRIQAAETERDRHLASMEHMTEEKVKKAKTEYEERINSMKEELKKLNSASFELARKQREHSRLEKERDRLLREVEEFKRQKVELSKKMREEAKRHREEQLARDREISGLRKAKLLADNQIRTLEHDRQRRETILKRNQEEMAFLRRRQANRPPVSKPVLNFGPAKTNAGPVARPQTAVASVGMAVVPTTAGLVPSTLQLRGTRKESDGVGNNLKLSNVRLNEDTYKRSRRNSILTRLAKNKWVQLEGVMSNVVNRRHMQARFDRDLNNWMREREKIKRRIVNLQNKASQLQDKESSQKQCKEIESKLRDLNAQLETTLEQIIECQANIVELGEESQADATVATVLAQCSLEEARYLLNHLFEETIQKSVLAEQKVQAEAHLRQLLASKTKEKEQALEMLQLAVTRPTQMKLDMDILSVEEGGEELETDSSDTSDDELHLGDTEYFELSRPGSFIDDLNNMKAPSTETIAKKLRSTSTTADDLLGQNQSSNNASSQVYPLSKAPEMRPAAASKEPRQPSLHSQNSVSNAPKEERPSTINSMMTMSMDESQLMRRSTLRRSFRYVPSAIKQQQQQLQQQQKSVRRKPQTSGSTTNGTNLIPGATSATTAASKGQKSVLSPTNGRPRVSNQTVGSTTNTSGSSAGNQQKMSNLMTQSMFASDSGNSYSSLDNIGGNMRSSSIMTTSITEGNVFNRLTSSTHRGSPTPTKGQITAYNRTNSRTLSKSPLECLFVAEGHVKPVLDVSLSNNILISGSKDRSAKVWDLNSMSEVLTLPNHSNNVVKVYYSPTTHFYFTASSFFINVYDERDPQRPVITLLSSGLTELPSNFSMLEMPGDSNGPVSATRQNICPAGETNITDFCLDPAHQDVLFMATGISVRYWDLHRYHATAKLQANHQAPVMALACDLDTSRGAGHMRLVTGSKDHYMKLFSVDIHHTSGIVTPVADLQPPHYDGIEALALSGEILFSGSRDACIKKWNLSGTTPREVANVTQAHKDWIQSMCLAKDNSYLLSACRGGLLKLWNVEDCANVGEVVAHTNAAGINAVRADDNIVVTAGNDSLVKLWKLNTENV